MSDEYPPGAFERITRGLKLFDESLIASLSKETDEAIAAVKLLKAQSDKLPRAHFFEFFLSEMEIALRGVHDAETIEQIRIHAAFGLSVIDYVRANIWSADGYGPSLGRKLAKRAESDSSSV